VANYFGEHGWRGGEPAFVKLDSTARKAESVFATGLELDTSVRDLRALGVDVPGLPADARAALMKMDLEGDDAEYWLGLHDYFVITRYNRSRMYALFAMVRASSRKRLRPQTKSFDASVERGSTSVPPWRTARPLGRYSLMATSRWSWVSLQ
jgi:membrane-bound lytic murein transglycosylase B